MHKVLKIIVLALMLIRGSQVYSAPPEKNEKNETNSYDREILEATRLEQKSILLYIEIRGMKLLWKKTLS